MNVPKLLSALNDESNEKLFDFTSDTIKQMNLNMIQELHLPRNESLAILRKLIQYRYVDELSDLKHGTYIRWISLENPSEIVLTRGAMFCEVKLTDDGIFLLCKNVGFNAKHFRIEMDKNLIFQKLTSQELTLLSALDYLSK